jgi:uncharacterized heparinase superfamily protein
MQTPLEIAASQSASRTSAVTDRATKAYQIARHYSWTKLVRRGFNVAAKRFSRRHILLPEPEEPPRLPTRPEVWRRAAAVVALDHHQRSSFGQTDLATGLFCLLNHQVKLGNPPNWSAATKEPHLWRFQLQYHEFLLPHLADGDSNPNLCWDFLEHWLNRFSTGPIDTRSDAWHPYCISRRLPAWIWLLTVGNPPASITPKLLRSLVLQAQYLSRHLEEELGGNHVLENLHALNLVAICFTGSKLSGELDKQASRLPRELETQVLPTGEHFERSPMYHCHVLANSLFTLIAAEAFKAEEVSELRRTASGMYRFLEGILHPDGEIPLFADSGFGEALSCNSIHQLAEICRLDRQSTTPKSISSDYWTCRNGPDFLVVDHGAIAAPSLPAHGHCDLLGFEASIGGRRWLVDSGNFDYDAGSMRHYCRSSLGHNVVTIDRQNTAEVWSKFRMGNRPSVKQVTQGVETTHQWLAATHDSHRRNGCGLSSRFFADSEKFWLCADHVHCQPQQLCEGWLHLAPEIVVDRLEANLLKLRFDSATRFFHFFGCDQMELTEGWYCSSFGERQKSPVICYRKSRDVDLFGWVMTKFERSKITRKPGIIAISGTQTDSSEPPGPVEIALPIFA